MTLWLDDVRDPAAHGHIGADWVKTATDAIIAIKSGKYDFVSLDHDLEFDHYGSLASAGTGYDVAKFLEEFPEYWPDRGVKVHSANLVGTLRMEIALVNAKSRHNVLNGGEGTVRVDEFPAYRRWKRGEG